MVSNYSKIIGLIIGILAVSLVGTTFVLAQSNVVSDNRPDSVSCSYDESKLSDYQPRLKIDNLDVKPSTVYAQYCTHDDKDYDVAMYWAYYPVQEGFTSQDSHHLDREPVYVFINSDGTVDKISYSGYHYIKATNPTPDIVDQHNSTLAVVNPHHHYYDIGADSYGSYPSIEDFSKVHEDWYANGWSANPEVTANPYEIENHSSWWSEDSSWNLEASEWYWEIKLQIQQMNPFSDDPKTDVET